MEVLYRLKANEPLQLDDQELVWIVRSGSLALFTKKVKVSRKAVLRWQNIRWNVPPGSAAFINGINQNQNEPASLTGEATPLGNSKIKNQKQELFF